jgi:hypothetical protein
MARQIPGMANPRGTAAVVAGLHTSGDREQLDSCPGPHERTDPIDLLVDAQNRHIWTASDLIGIQPTFAHIERRECARSPWLPWSLSVLSTADPRCLSIRP